MDIDRVPVLEDPLSLPPPPPHPTVIANHKTEKTITRPFETLMSSLLFI
jgi:hypothetical protein